MTEDSDSDTTEVELENVNYSEINDKAMTVFERVAESVEQPVTQVVDNLPRMGIDPTEITEDQAERFLQAEEEEDPEEFDAVLEDLGVPEQVREQMVDGFRSNLDGGARPDDESNAAGDTDVNSSPPAGPANGNSSGAPSRAEVQQMVQREVQQSMPDADQIASQLEQRMGGGQQGGGIDPQKRMAMELAKNFLGNNQPANPGAEQMAQAQSQMMEGFGSIMQGIAEGITNNMEIRFEGDASPEPPGDDDDDDEGGEE